MKMFSVILAVITVFSPSCFSEVTSVDPPDNVTVSDLGLLGQLVIHWSPPASLQNVTDCSIRYQLEYFSTYKNEWRGYRTHRTSFRAQFDLERDVRVRLHTMMRGRCTNGVERISDSLELLWPPRLTGLENSRVRNFHCVFHMKQHMECTWERGTEEPQHTQRFLYYWHDGLEAVAECPEYIMSQGIRTGCRFPGDRVKEFTDFNMCVNGTSARGPLRAAYVSLQVQNHVKPGQVGVEAMSLEPLQEGGELLLRWSPPTGHVPPQCLEYEVTSEHTDQNGKEWRIVNITEDTSLVLPANQRSCARVRSRVNEYCSDSSFWSDWSQWKCLPATEKPSPAMDIALICVLVASAIALLSLCISVWLFSKTWWKKREKAQHYSLFWENPHPKPAVSC